MKIDTDWFENGTCHETSARRIIQKHVLSSKLEANEFSSGVKVLMDNIDENDKRREEVEKYVRHQLSALTINKRL